MPGSDHHRYNPPRLLWRARALAGAPRGSVELLAVGALRRGRDVDRLDVVELLREGTLSIAAMRFHLARFAPGLLAAFEDCVRDARARPGWLQAHRGLS